MKYLNVFTIVAILLLSSCKEKAKKEVSEPKIEEIKETVLVHKWSADTLLTTSESVIYDKKRDILYVSNIAGVPDEADGIGFISKVDLEGNITDVNWISGLDAPKGLGIVGDKLYVTDLTNLVEIDIDAGKVSKTIPIEGSVFLNDITTTSDGKVYISDSNGGNFFVYENGMTTRLMEGLPGPNGVLSDGDTFLMALWDEKTLNTLNLETNEITKRTEGIENPDGIEAVGDGSYLVSSWQGLVHLVNADWSKKILLDTSSDEIGAADIEYIQEKNLLLVPTFYKNGLMAYELIK
ncbi:sugar lactone lactonase YvrE [Saonia flava]|uniref:Sugar lactone lactonase YvrE n=1 Tax=Saonia flava TaxID=523696 RepID=A0A846QRQ3_9FLAO|nr:hypothetical protein [Saonia flava]NJB69877.1 sugar lactone lactonase YvrE [Saonia flava]